MFEKFTEEEKRYLNALKKNIGEQPKEYFLHQYCSLKDFKDINYSMWMSQWQYASSGFILMVQTLKTLKDALNSLIALNFSHAALLASNATQDIKASVTKLTVALGLLCLNLFRSITLFTATFFPQLLSFSWSAYVLYLTCPEMAGLLIATSICAGLLLGGLLAMVNKSYKSNPSVTKKNVKPHEIDALVTLYKQVNEESNTVSDIFGAFIEHLKLEISFKSQRFFSTNPETIEWQHETIEWQRESHEWMEYCSELNKLRNTYPESSIDLIYCQPNYANSLHKELADHHAKVMIMAEIMSLKMQKKQEQQTDECNSLTFIPG